MQYVVKKLLQASFFTCIIAYIAGIVKKEYENYARRSFLEKVFGGVFTVQQIYEEAAKLSLDLDGPCYNLILLNLQVKRQNPEYAMQEPEGVEQVREALFRYFMRFPEYLIFQWNISLYGVLIKGEADQMRVVCKRGLIGIERTHERVFGVNVERCSEFTGQCLKRDALAPERAVFPIEILIVRQS